MSSGRFERAILAAAALAYAIAFAAASARPGPRAWAIHLAGFLPAAERAFVLALLFGGALWLAFALARSRPPGEERARGENVPRRGPPRRGAKPGRAGRREIRDALPARGTLPAWSAWLLLLPWGIILWTLRSRTQFLGDGVVWLENLGSGQPSPYSEPLAAAIWSGYAHLLRAARIPINASTAGAFSVLCGLAAAPLLWGIAREITPRYMSRALALALLATLGISQLYFGYIESYPPTAVLLLAYLWLGLRRAQGADQPLWLAVLMPLLLASHLAMAFLLPSYLYLVYRERRPLVHRALLALLPLGAVLGLLLVLRYRPAQWLGSLEIAAQSARPGHAPAALARPYGVISGGHAWDLLNAVLLVLPVPALLLLARAAGSAFSYRRRPGNPASTTAGPDAPGRFLAVAALAGALVAAGLVLPVPPAQDWDLTSLLLVPLAVFALRFGLASPRSLARGSRGPALVAIGAGALLSFVLVNADEGGGVRRFGALLAPGAKVTAYGRAYGNELLATYFAERKDHPEALRFARRALEAEPTNPRYWIKVGAQLYETGRYGEAVEALREGVRRGPSRDDGYYNLGNCLVRTGHYTEAIASYREALRLTKPRPDYEHNLGVALFRAGRTDSARTVWLSVTRRWPGYILSLRSLRLHFGEAAAESAAAGSYGQVGAAVSAPSR